MSHAAPDPSAASAEDRAEELRSLAGPVNGEGTDDVVAPDDTPDARTAPALDEVREAEQGDVGSEADPYELRSMPAQPNPTADDPASDLNF